ncbi:probable serine threonine- kinase roco4 isoform X1, partial [Paramuricea clavata]
MTCTKNLGRGTAAFMAPEVTLPDLAKLHDSGSMDFLKKVDIWALGLVFYNLVNPSLNSPYKYDLVQNGVDTKDYSSFIEEICRKRSSQRQCHNLWNFKLLGHGNVYTVRFLIAHHSIQPIDLKFLKFSTFLKMGSNVMRPSVVVANNELANYAYDL